MIHESSIVKNVELNSTAMVDSFVFLYGQPDSPIKIGAYCHVASFVSILGGPCTLGDFSCLGSGTRVVAGSDSFSGDALVGSAVPKEYRKVSRRGVVLEPHAIVGTGCIIMEGVTIGEGSCIGAGSVVTKNVPAWEIWFGSPAKFHSIRPRGLVLKKAKELLEK